MEPYNRVQSKRRWWARGRDSSILKLSRSMFFRSFRKLNTWAFLRFRKFPFISHFQSYGYLNLRIQDNNFENVALTIQLQKMWIIIVCKEKGFRIFAFLCLWEARWMCFVKSNFTIGIIFVQTICQFFIVQLSNRECTFLTHLDILFVLGCYKLA